MLCWPRQEFTTTQGIMLILEQLAGNILELAHYPSLIRGILTSLEPYRQTSRQRRVELD